MKTNLSKLTDKQLAQYNKNEKKMRTIADYTTLYEKKLPMKEDILFAESYSGNFLSHSIVQFVKQVLNKKKEMHVVLSTSNMKSFYQAFSIDEQKRILVVKRDSNKYLFALVQAKFIINDGDFPDYFIARHGQIVINTAESFFGFYTDKLSAYEKRSQRAILQSNYLLMSESVKKQLFTRLRLHDIKDFYLATLKTNTQDQKSDWNILFLKKDSKLDSANKLKKFISESNITNKVIILVHPSELSKYQNFSEFGRYVKPFDYSIEKYINKAQAVYSDNEFLLDKPVFDSLDRYIILENLKTDSFSVSERKNEFSADQLLFNKDKWLKYPNKKKNIIIYAGGFQNNGVTTSSINLSFNIDYSKYNIIYIDKWKYDEDSEKNVLKLNDSSTLIFRTGATDYLMEERQPAGQLQSVKGFDSLSKKNKVYAQNVFKRELTRLLGCIDIDVAIDFSGYVVFWTSIMAFSNARVKLIYQHNDMFAELSKVVNGKLKHADKLPQVFQLYKFFDSVVSVGQKTLELNAEHLSEYANRKQYKYVANSIVVDDIRNKANDYSNVVHINGSDYLVEDNVFKILPDKKTFTLVNIGRMGPEKDQKKLISAFYEAKKKLDMPIKLFILGSGELEESLKKQVSNMKLESDVVFSGQVNNPYIFLNRADAFILTSNHEGQPMVLLEALTLDKPIIATDIAGNRSVLGEKYKDYLVNNSEKAISKEIVELCLSQNYERTNRLSFDAKGYNEYSMDLFYKLIED
ncbi:glycosyltransferase [Weissella paramesenteroides]|uniref:glycosyltransferase n=1 Tax=Weissella paramesenteroides TaxID=1249 RepID=UPI003F203BE5